MRNPIRHLAVGLVLLMASGCAKRSAESAVAAAEKAVGKVEAEASKVSPIELKAVVDSIAAMKGHIAAGDYRAALMGARSASSMVRDLESGIATRKEQLTNSFNALSAELPKQMASVTSKVAELAAMRRLPAGMDPAMVAGLKTETGGWQAAWDGATKAFADGNLADALTQARAISDKVTAAMTRLGLS